MKSYRLLLMLCLMIGTGLSNNLCGMQPTRVDTLVSDPSSINTRLLKRIKNFLDSPSQARSGRYQRSDSLASRVHRLTFNYEKACDELREIKDQPGFVIHRLVALGYRSALELLFAEKLVSEAEFAVLLNTPLIMHSLLPTALLAARVAQSGGGICPIHLAAYGGDESLVRMLLEHGVRHDVGDAHGRSALYYAVDQGHAKIVTLLVDRGADVKQIITLHRVRGFSGRKGTLLFVAAADDNIPLMEQLVQAGVEIDYANERGENALHYAALHNAFSAVRWLKRRGISLEKVSEVVRLTRQAHFERLTALLEPGPTFRAASHLT